LKEADRSNKRNSKTPRILGNTRNKTIVEVGRIITKEEEEVDKIEEDKDIAILKVALFNGYQREKLKDKITGKVI